MEKKICLFKMNTEDNFKNLCDLTTNLVGLPKGSLALKCRKLEYQVPRMIAAMVARIEDGTHREVIAKVLDRDRTSVNHYEVRHALNYASFPKYRDTFNLIYNAYFDLNSLRNEKLDVKHPKGVMSIKLPEEFDTEKPLRVKSKGFHNTGDLFVKLHVKFKRT